MYYSFFAPLCSKGHSHEMTLFGRLESKFSTRYSYLSEKPSQFSSFLKSLFFRQKISCFYEITLLILLILLNTFDERKRKNPLIWGCFEDHRLLSRGEFSFSIFWGITSKEFYRSKQATTWCLIFSTKRLDKRKKLKTISEHQTVLMMHSKNIFLSDFTLPFTPIQFGKFSLLMEEPTARYRNTMGSYKLASYGNCVLVTAWKHGHDNSVV